MKSQSLAYVILAIGLALSFVANAAAQTTNAIPKNVFLTDDGKVFWYKPGTRVVDVETINAARNFPESRPADDDPDGHWGAPTDGFQLSLRFEKTTFTNNEPIIATLLLRNVTNTPVKFLRTSISHRPSPINVLAFRGKEQLPRRVNDGKMEVISATEIDIYPQTQREYKVRLNDYYDLTSGGGFVFQAAYDGQAEITSQNVSIRIQN